MTRRSVHPLFILLLGTTCSFLFSFWLSQSLASCLLRTRLSRYQKGQRFDTLVEETHSKTFMLISVMSSGKYIDTRARSVWDTWGQSVPGKLIFFTGRLNGTRWKDMPIIQLDVEDNAYPPQRKSFTMLKYIYKNMLHSYQWFVRADDDTYLKTALLAAFLKRFDSSEDIVIGQPGIGKKEELGMLGLGKDDNFCIGGTGISMTSSILKKIGPHLMHCLNRTMSSHEDVEVGRCIKRFAGAMCPWAYEMKEFFSQVSCDSEPCSYRGPLHTMEMEKTINLHPLKNPADLRRTHVAFLTHKVQKLGKKQLKLREILKKTKSLIQAISRPKHVDLRKTRIRRQKVAPKSNSYPLPWEHFDFSKIWALYENSPLRYIHYSTEVAMKKFVGSLKETILRESESSFHNLNFGKYHTGYMRVRPTRGLEFVVEISVKYQKRKQHDVQVTQARRFLHSRQDFGNPTYSFLENADRKTTLNFILPLVGRPEMFKLFLASFEQEFLFPKEPVKLLVIYFPDAESPVEQRKAFQRYAAKYPFALTWIDFKGPFMKAAALQLGVNYFSNNSLVVTCDVDVIFRREFANRCREMTAMGKRAYFPVVFSEFNPSVTYAANKSPGTHYYYAKDAGLWRVFGFGLCCAYAEDIHRSGGLKTELIGWGMEDVDLYDKFVSNDEIVVFRAPDPGLVHVYHPHVACLRDTTKNFRDMCLGAQADRYVSSGAVIDYFNMKGRLDDLVTNWTLI